MGESRSLQLVVWVAIGAALATLGGALVGATIADGKGDVWAGRWFLTGFSVMLLGLVILAVIAALMAGAAYTSRRGRNDRGELSASFEYLGKVHVLAVEIRNDGPTLRDAGVNLYVPTRSGRPVMIKDGKRVRGFEDVSPEPVLGEETAHFHDKNLHILGGGNVTPLYFRGLNGPPGDYPLVFTVYDDEQKPCSLELRATFTIPPRPIDAGRRAQALGRIHRELSWHKHVLLRAAGQGEYWRRSSDRAEIYERSPELTRRNLDWDGKDAELAEQIAAAYSEIHRIKKLAEDEVCYYPANRVPVQGDHRLEGAIVTHIVALQRVEKVLDVA